MKRTAIVNWLEFIPTYCLFSLFRFLGMKRGGDLGSWMARKVGPYLKNNQFAQKNLADIYSTVSEEKRAEILRDMWDNLGRLPAESMTLDQFSLNDHIHVIGAEHIQGKGPYVFIGAHLANFAMMTRAIHLLGKDIVQLYRRLNNPLVNDLLLNAQQRGGVSAIYKGGEGAKAAMTLLKNGKSIIFLCDQKLGEGVEIPFMGRPAKTPTGPVRIACKLKIPLIPVHVVRHGSAPQFTVVFHPPLETDDRSATQIMTGVNTLFEQWITENPAQWLWVHRRWKQ